MSKLAREITANKAVVTVPADKREVQKALAQSMLNSVSGGWVNAFARWGKSF
ncbi:putative rSAM-modified RiPP, XyeA family [Kosakonia cowanii]|nr:putative rSAM-modified RiPP, XyeA family [Kosakonia cowanii]